MSSDGHRPAGSGVLRAEGVTAGYGEVRVLRNVSFGVDEGEVLSIIGPNGAGKTTLMRVLVGLLAPDAGTVRLAGTDVTGADPHERVARGVALVSEERNLFRGMTVRENLVMGAYRARDGDRADRLERVFELFPRLGKRPDQTAGTLSGGEAQMLAIGRGLMMEPRVLLLDEPSLGLAPKLVPELFGRIDEINRGGVTVVIVEQRARRALEVADVACLLENGRIVDRGDAAEMLEDEAVVERYLGGGG